MVYGFMQLTKSTCRVGKRYNIEGEYWYVAEGLGTIFGDYADDTPLCQMTTCGDCKAKLVSWAKNAHCPKCSKLVYLT